MKLKSLILIFSIPTYCLFTALTANAAPQTADIVKDESYNLMLIGGQIEICNNGARQFCERKVASAFDKEPLLEEFEYSESTLRPVTQTQGYKSLPSNIKSKLDQIFAYFYDKPKKVNSITQINSPAYSTAFDFNAQEFIDNLPKDVYYAILDYARLKTYPDMKVELEKSISLAAKEILATFVKQAQLKRKSDEVLTLKFLTSSQRNPFEDVSWYQQAFTQTAKMLAIEDDTYENIHISWIPLEQSLMQAIEIEKLGGEGCSQLVSLRNKNNLFNVAVRYPKLNKLQHHLCRNPEELESFFADAHGIFFGDADFVGVNNALSTMSLFRTKQGQYTNYHEIIQRRFINSEVFVAGNGEGARILSGGIFANRPVPMITGGTGTASLVRGAFALPPAPSGCDKGENCPFGMTEDDLTYENMGGMGLFSNGIVDTHFSSQNRHARMATLAAASKTRFGFGIDTNTALLVAKQIEESGSNTSTKLKVIGDQGVYIIDMRDGIVKTQSGKHQIIGLSHNINQGDVLFIDNSTMELTFSFSQTSQLLSQKGLVIPMNEGVYHRNVSFNCGTTTFHRWNEENIAWLINPAEDTRFLINRNQWGETCSYNNLLFGVEN